MVAAEISTLAVFRHSLPIGHQRWTWTRRVKSLDREKFTEDDLNRWLEELPKLSDDVVSRDLWWMSERASAFKRVAEIVYLFSIEKGETAEQTKERLSDARVLFLNLLTTLVSRREWPLPDDLANNYFKEELKLWLEREIWHHRDDLLSEFINRGYRGDEDFNFRRRYVSSFGAALIERPWLDSRYMEWVIVDALVCNAVRQCGAFILASEPNNHYFLFVDGTGRTRKGMKHLGRVILIRWIMRLLLLLVLPLGGIWYGLWSGNALSLFTGAAVGGLYLCWSAYVTIRAEVIQLLGRQLPRTALQSKVELWDSMHRAYRMLDGAVVDPTRLMRALDAATEKGAVWDGAVYAILNRAIARDPIAWVTNDSHAYTGQKHRPAPTL